ncbi:MAG TPA: MerR family transcriptional regulator [Allosphingosinicella sp.]
MAGKSEQAFRTISELAGELGVPQHILRYWETRFPQLRPLQRAGNRRYYRPDDVALARRIHHLLNSEGYTIRGVQQVLGKKGGAEAEAVPELAHDQPARALTPSDNGPRDGLAAERLRVIRSSLAAALEESR